MKNLGNTNVEDSITIVGSRDCTKYSKDVCKKIVEGIDKTIVTSLDIGISKVVIDNAKRVVAITDEEDLEKSLYNSLSKKILENGGGIIFSKEKNNLLSKISEKIVIVECDYKSISQRIAAVGIEYGKDVYVVPHEIFSKKASSTNFLIKQGAYLLDRYEDLAN